MWLIKSHLIRSQKLQKFYTVVNFTGTRKCEEKKKFVVNTLVRPFDLKSMVLALFRSILLCFVSIQLCLDLTHNNNCQNRFVLVFNSKLSINGFWTFNISLFQFKRCENWFFLHFVRAKPKIQKEKNAEENDAFLINDSFAGAHLILCNVFVCMVFYGQDICFLIDFIYCDVWFLFQSF